MKRELASLADGLGLLAEKPRTGKRLFAMDKAKVAKTQIRRAAKTIVQEAYAKVDLAALARDSRKAVLAALAALEDASQGTIDSDALKGAIIALRPFAKGSVEFRLEGRIPAAIREEILLDHAEMLICYEKKAYRSALILAALIMEVCLHRKYYEVTGKDILETNPDIGLGKLIAKLSEHGVHFDPGLMNQIHLLNSLRIHSVHKKEELFRPTQNQTKAIILLTLELVRKLF